MELAVSGEHRRAQRAAGPSAFSPAVLHHRGVHSDGADPCNALIPLEKVLAATEDSCAITPSSAARMTTWLDGADDGPRRRHVEECCASMPSSFSTASTVP